MIDSRMSRSGSVPVLLDGRFHRQDSICYCNCRQRIVKSNAIKFNETDFPLLKYFLYHHNLLRFYKAKQKNPFSHNRKSFPPFSLYPNKSRYASAMAISTKIEQGFVYNAQKASENE